MTVYVLTIAKQSVNSQSVRVFCVATIVTAISKSTKSCGISDMTMSTSFYSSRYQNGNQMPSDILGEPQGTETLSCQI